MKEHRIQNFIDFHAIVEKYEARSVIYRGVKSVRFPLLPKIGRVVPPDSIDSREKNEQEILRLFKERAFQYLDFTPTTDWDWLAVGQQYGLPTRLLDWTDNPLVACFFSIDESSDDDGVVYAYRDDSYISVDEHTDPFRYRSVGKFIPRHFVQRITTQGGLFTIHPNPYEPFESDAIEKIIVPSEIQAELRDTLNKYGINQFSLFPSLDGLAAHIEWLQSTTR
jgi:type I restriction enzyme M protein